MISSYFDESGTHDGSLVIVVAGLVSTPIRWEKLAKEWQRVLERAGLDDFHTADCCTGYGVFQGWEPERRKQLLISLVQIVKRHVMYRTWTAIVMADYNALMEKNDLDYAICAFGCASRLRTLSLSLLSQPLIPYIFDRGGRGGERALAAFNKLIEEGRSDFYRMGSIKKSERRRCLPLQAADLHAYEVYKYFGDQLARSGRPPRRSFQELWSIKEAGNGGYLFNGKKLERMLVGMKNSEHPIQIAVDPLNKVTRVTVEPPR